MLRAERLGDGPIVRADPDDPAVGDNVNGPSLVRAPEWLPGAPGRYLLYFAHHRGPSIRLAVADRLEGPWTIHRPGVLSVERSTCLDHVASPDVHVDPGTRSLRMYFHGVVLHPPDRPDPHANAVDGPPPIVQRSKLAISRDGLGFEARDAVLGPSYLRAFRRHDAWYALAMPGILYRSPDGIAGFERGPQILPDSARHHAVAVRGDTLHLFYTRCGDRPERILHACVSLAGSWRTWRPGPPSALLEPERDWEGASLPLEPSRRGLAPGPVRQLRDPAIFEEDGRTFLLYSVAGEQGIAIARLHGL